MRKLATHTRYKWSSYLFIFFTALLGLSTLAVKANLEIETDIENAVQTIRQIYVTEDGLEPKSDGSNILVELNPEGTQGDVNIKGDVLVGDTEPTATKHSKIQVIGNFMAGSGTNVVSGEFSSIGGGHTNVIDGESSTIGAGRNNTINGDLNTIPGGFSNEINGYSSNISAGGYNVINSERSTIGGGRYNVINGNDGVIAGGSNNNINANYGVVAGGSDNNINADYGWAGGYRTQVDHAGSFVWADPNWISRRTAYPPLGVFSTTLPNTFLIYASNGVGINTNAPTSELDVKGTVSADGFVMDDGTADVGKIMVALDTAGTASWRDLTVNKCAGSIPSHSVANGNGEFVTIDVSGEIETRNREYDEEYGSCHFVCAAGYVWSSNQCEEIINGQCATPDHTTSRYTAPTSLCAKGTVNWTDTGAGRGDWQWNWQCIGSNGGTTASCYTNRNMDGECGPVAGNYLSSRPTSNLCEQGYDLTPTVTDNGGEQDRYTWTCAKVNNGTSASCSAHYNQRVRACSGLPTNGAYYNNSTYYTITQTTTNHGSSWSPTLTAYYGDGTPNANTCEYRCLAGYHYYGGQCISNQCPSSNEPSGSQYVKGPTTYTSGPAKTSWVPSSVTPLPACTYNCSDGYTLNGLVCEEDDCPATTMTMLGPAKGTHDYTISATPHDTSKTVTSETVGISYGTVNYTMSVSCNEGEYTTGPETYNLISCSTDYYSANGTSCTAVGNGYYSPSGSTTRTACTNKPDNSYYTSDGNGANKCSWSCSSGYRNVNGSCVNTCTLDGITRSHGQAYSFYNKASGTCTTNNCGSTVSRTCDGETGLFGGDDSYDESSCTDNSNTISCTIINGGGTKSCTAGSTTWGVCYVNSCDTDYYATAPNECGPVGVGYYSPSGSTTRTACTNKPANSYYTSDGNGSNNCSWTCDLGYHAERGSCVEDQTCGNLVVEGTETCDGGYTTTSIGGVSARRFCNATCDGYGPQVINNACDVSRCDTQAEWPYYTSDAQCNGDWTVSNVVLRNSCTPSEILDLQWDCSYGSYTQSCDSYAVSCDYNPGGGSCFIAGTKVRMADGTEKNIEDVKVGDIVVGQTQNNKVEVLFPLDNKGYMYSMNGSQDYFVSESHPFLTTEGWKSFNPAMTKEENPSLYVTKLEVGDLLIREDGVEMLTTFKSKIDYVKVYNFGLNGDRTYYADGYLVHNVEGGKSVARLAAADPIPCGTPGGPACVGEEDIGPAK